MKPHRYAPADPRNPSSGGCVCGIPWPEHESPWHAGWPVRDQHIPAAYSGKHRVLPSALGAQAAPDYPAVGSVIPPEMTGGMTGFIVAECGHRVAGSEWAAGFRTCERCSSEPEPDDPPRCWSCGHPWDAGCGCSCCGDDAPEGWGPDAI